MSDELAVRVRRIYAAIDAVQEPTWPTVLDVAGALGVSVGAFVYEGRTGTTPKRPRGRPPKPNSSGPAPNRRGRQKTNREGSR